MIRIEIDDREVRQALEALARRLGPGGMKPAMAEIGEALSETTKQRFVASTAPDGARWAANAESTLLALMRRKSRGGLTKKRGGTKAKAIGALAGKKPLIASGELAHTIRYQLIPGGVAIGTNRFANLFDGGAAVHQFGSRNGRIPARPFLGLSAADKRSVLEIVEEHLAGR